MDHTKRLIPLNWSFGMNEVDKYNIKWDSPRLNRKYYVCKINRLPTGKRVKKFENFLVGYLVKNFLNNKNKIPPDAKISAILASCCLHGVECPCLAGNLPPCTNNLPIRLLSQGRWCYGLKIEIYFCLVPMRLCNRGHFKYSD